MSDEPSDEQQPCQKNNFLASSKLEESKSFSFVEGESHDHILEDQAQSFLPRGSPNLAEIGTISTAPIQKSSKNFVNKKRELKPSISHEFDENLRTNAPSFLMLKEEAKPVRHSTVVRKERTNSMMTKSNQISKAIESSSKDDQESIDQKFSELGNKIKEVMQQREEARRIERLANKGDIFCAGMPIISDADLTDDEIDQETGLNKKYPLKKKRPSDLPPQAKLSERRITPSFTLVSGLYDSGSPSHQENNLKVPSSSLKSDVIPIDPIERTDQDQTARSSALASSSGANGGGTRRISNAGSEKEKEDNQKYLQQVDKALDIKKHIRMVTTFNILSIILSLADSEVRWFLRKPPGDSSDVVSGFVLVLILQLLRLANLAATLISLYNTYHWYTCVYTQMMRQSKVLYQSRWPLEFKTNFILTQLINVLHIPFFIEGWNIVEQEVPSLNGDTIALEYYDFSQSQWIDYITMLTFLKLYILYPQVKQLSIFNSSSGKLIGKMIEVNMNEMIYVKTWLKGDPLKLIIFVWSLLILCCGILIHLAERLDPIDCSDSAARFSSLGNCIWYVIITIFTVGYGDMSTGTLLGQTISLATAFVGLLISALLIGIAQQQITLNDEELKVIQFMVETKQAQRFKDVALTCVKSFIRIYVRKYMFINHNRTYTEQQLRKDFAKMEETINLFRMLRKETGNIHQTSNDIGLIEYEVSAIQEVVTMMNEYLSTKKVIVSSEETSIIQDKQESSNSAAAQNEERERQFQIKKKLARVMQGTQGIMNLNKTLSKVNVLTRSEEDNDLDRPAAERDPLEPAQQQDEASSSSSSDPQSEFAQKFKIQQDFYSRSNKFGRKATEKKEIESEGEADGASPLIPITRQSNESQEKLHAENAELKRKIKKLEHKRKVDRKIIRKMQAAMDRRHKELSHMKSRLAGIDRKLEGFFSQFNELI